MSARRKRNKRQFVNPADLAPSVAAGLTQDVSLEELIADDRGRTPGGLKVIQHMNQDKKQGRVPIPHFVAEQKNTGLVRESLGRKMVDAEITFTVEVFNAIKAGLICLKCLEPQSSANADDHVPGCEGVLVHGPQYMRDFHMVKDIALECEGDARHIGPSKPMQEYQDEMDARHEREKFDRKILEGHSKGRVVRAS